MRYYVLGLLLACNLIKYLDRQVLYPLLPLIGRDLLLTDTQLGALATAFMTVYMCAAPLAGWLADRGRRTRWLAAGVGLWSAATVCASSVRGYAGLLVMRASAGMGESAYGATAPAYVAEHFPKPRRGMVLAVYSLAIPVGSALGYIMGGWSGQNLGWRSALILAGLPGLFLAVLVWMLKDPRAARKETQQDAPAGDASSPKLSDYPALYKVRSYVCASTAMAVMSFGLGGLAVWMPTFFTRTWGMNVARAGMLFGSLTVAAGLVGSLAGGWLADRLLKRTGKAYFLVSGAGLLLAMPAGIAALAFDSLRFTLAALLVAETLAFMNMGPLNGAIVWVTKSRMRSMAFAANIFVVHALGDAPSPTIIGALSDHWGLRPALVLPMLALGVAGGICLLGTHYIEEDSEAIEEPTVTA